jgi:hypothetical protein
VSEAARVRWSSCLGVSMCRSPTVVAKAALKASLCRKASNSLEIKRPFLQLVRYVSAVSRWMCVMNRPDCVRKWREWLAEGQRSRGNRASEWRVVRLEEGVECSEGAYLEHPLRAATRAEKLSHVLLMRRWTGLQQNYQARSSSLVGPLICVAL